MELENTMDTAQDTEQLTGGADDVQDTDIDDEGESWFAGGSVEDDSDDAQTAEADEHADGAQPAEDAQAEQSEAAADEHTDTAEQAQANNQGDADKAGEVVKLRYYGKDVEVPAQEIPALAQKGMDYDKVRAERDALASGETGQALSLIGEFAQLAGKSVPDYIAYARQQAEGLRVQAAANENGMDEAAAQRFVAMQRELEALRGEKQQQSAAEAEQQQRVEQMQELLAYAPSVRELPEEVTQAIIEKGMTPLNAYIAWENTQLKAKLAHTAQKTQNKQAAPGSAQGYGTSDKLDPFSSGFLAGDE